MSFVKLDFLNWRPDQDDWNHDGLVEADNVIHSSKGYLPFTTFSTSGFTPDSNLGTCPSIVMKSVGTAEQQIVAFLHNGTLSGVGFTIDFSIGLMDSRYSGIGLYTTYTSSTISSGYTGNNIVAFDVCELDDKIFFSAQAELPTSTILNASAPVITLNSTGYATI